MPKSTSKNTVEMPKVTIDALFQACKAGDEQRVSELLGHFADAELVMSAGENIVQSPLSAACEGGHLATVRLLLNKGVLANHASKYGNTPLAEACTKTVTSRQPSSFWKAKQTSI